jgi:hypothetical protein
MTENDISFDDVLAVTSRQQIGGRGLVPPHTRTAPDLRFRRSWAVLVCAPVGIRTPNLLIRSQMLYPLSYRRLSHP